MRTCVLPHTATQPLVDDVVADVTPSANRLNENATVVVLPGGSAALAPLDALLDGRERLRDLSRDLRSSGSLRSHSEESRDDRLEWDHRELDRAVRRDTALVGARRSHEGANHATAIIGDGFDVAEAPRPCTHGFDEVADVHATDGSRWRRAPRERHHGFA
jgi:hypothetical protein